MLCTVCRDIQSRFVTPMPRRSKQDKRKPQDDLLGGVDEASAAESGDDATTVSSDAGHEDDEAQAQAEPEQRPARISASTTHMTVRPARQGMPASTWLQVLKAMQPSKVVLAGTVTFQAGLLYAILQYNDSVFGLQQCPLVGFCAQQPPCPTAVEWTKKHVKQWQTNHLCLHSVERSLAAYASRRYSAVVANQQKAMSGAQRVLRREGTDSSYGLCSVAESEPPKVLVTKFIMPHGHQGKEPKLLPRPPSGQDEPDSDDPDGDAPSSDMAQNTLSKRNARFTARRGVKVSLSSEASGHGLFSVKDIAVGTELPVKGPWFNTLEEVHRFLEGLHVDTAEMLSKRVVRLDLAPGAADGHPAASQGQEQQKPTSLYKVITNPVGFINHFTALQTTPDCKLILKEGMPLGEHGLVVKSTRAIKEGKQWLFTTALTIG